MVKYFYEQTSAWPKVPQRPSTRHDRVVLRDGTYIVLSREWDFEKNNAEPQVYVYVRP